MLKQNDLKAKSLYDKLFELFVYYYEGESSLLEIASRGDVGGKLENAVTVSTAAERDE